MNPTPFPTAAIWSLPVAALRKPLPAAPEQAESAEHPAPAPADNPQSQAELVSAAIARRIRQRRHT